MSGPDFLTGPIYAFRKGSGQVLVGEREYRTTRFIDVRYWADGGATPTGKGLGIPLHEVRALAEALLAFDRERSGEAPE